MSHGNSGGIFGVGGKVLKISEIQKMFDTNTCPQLKGKPKLFFIQACRVDGEYLSIYLLILFYLYCLFFIFLIFFFV